MSQPGEPVGDGAEQHAESSVSEPIRTERSSNTSDNSLDESRRPKSYSSPIGGLGKPTASCITHESVTLQWTKDQDGSENHPECYTVSYRSVGDHTAKANSRLRWKQLTTDTDKESVTVSGLASNTSYVFKVRSECAGSDLGVESEVSGTITTKGTSPPGKPIPSTVTDTSVQLEWSKPEYGNERVESYTVQVLYDGSIHRELKTAGPQESVRVQELDTRKRYQFRVFPECHGEGCVGMESEMSETVETKATSPPGRPTVFRVTYNSAHLKWIKPEVESASIEGYEVLYRNTQEEEESEWIRRLSCGQKLLMNINDLDLGTEYLFKVVPICSVGCGSESELSDPARTKATSPPGKPTASSATHNSVDLKWSEPEHRKGEIGSYVCRAYICTEDKMQTLQLKTTTSSPEGETTVEGLLPKMEYVFTVQPLSLSGDKGTESESSNHIKTKPVRFKPGKPRGEATAHDEIHLTWTRPDHGHYLLGSYSVCYRKVSEEPSPSWEKYHEEITTHQESYEYHCSVGGLSSATRYTFKVQSHFNDGKKANESEASEPVSTKAASSPGQPAVSKVTHNSVHLQWTRPNSGEENIDCYTVKIREIEGPVKSVQTDGETESMLVQGLTGETTYTFSVLPHSTRYGEGLASQESEEIETLASCKPGEVRLVSSTHNTITLKWQRPENYAQCVDCYHLTYHSTDHSGEISDITDTTCIVKGLVHNTDYTFAVRPVCKTSSESGHDITEPSITAPIATMATSPPGTPIKTKSTHDSVTLQWTKPEIGSESVECYRVLFHEKPTRFASMFSSQPVTSVRHTDGGGECVFTVSGLRSGTRYIFRVQGECEGGRLGSESEASEVMETLSLGFSSSFPI